MKEQLCSLIRKLGLNEYCLKEAGTSVKNQDYLVPSQPDALKQLTQMDISKCSWKPGQPGLGTAKQA